RFQGPLFLLIRPLTTISGSADFLGAADVVCPALCTSRGSVIVRLFDGAAMIMQTIIVIHHH
ncbi:MAG: hypothetical protein B7Y49_04725, partial [Sphingomonas sp. 28-62-11]